MEQKIGSWVRPEDWTTGHKILSDLGYCGHYLHVNSGGRSGKKHILTCLGRHGGQMTQRELQESFDICPGSLSEVLAKVEAEGLIERTRSASDRRQLDIRLTEAGGLRAAEFEREKLRFERTAFETLDEDEMGELLGMLDRVVDHWEDMACAN